jgi:hypothetical protein
MMLDFRTILAEATGVRGCAFSRTEFLDSRAGQQANAVTVRRKRTAGTRGEAIAATRRG